MDSSKSPFDSSNFSGQGESAANESTSATRMFGKITPQATPPPEQDDLLQSLLRAEQTPAKSSLPEAPLPPPPQPPPAATPQASGMGSFPQMFQALKSTEPQPVKEETQPLAPFAPPAPAPPPKPPADLTSVFSPVSINKPAAVPPSSAEPRLGEFTQLLQTLNNPLLKVQPAPPPPKFRQ